MTDRRIQPWTDEQLDAREERLAASVQAEIVRLGELAQENLEMPQASLGSLVAGAWQTYAVAELAPEIADVYTDGAAFMAEELAQDVPSVVSSLVQEYLGTIHNRLVGIGDNIWLAMQQELVAGVEAGEGIPELAARLEAFPGINEYRARTVARTEVIGAANAGSYAQAELSGLEMRKEWLATDDERTRTSHRHADHDAVPLHETFTIGIYAGDVHVGDEQLRFPGDPLGSAGNVINCRCAPAYLLDEDLITAGFVESEHPRGPDGKFVKKGISAVSEISHVVSKAGTDKRTGKRVAADKPIFLRVKALFETSYADRAVVAVRPESKERLVWDESTKRMQRQRQTARGWKTTETLTRGGTKARYGNEEGWRTPPAEQDIKPAVAPAQRFPRHSVAQMRATQQRMLPLEDLTTPQRKAIEAYALMHYEDINGALREGRDPYLAKTAQFTTDLQSAMRPLPENVRVYRTFPWRPKGPLPQDLAELEKLVGKTFMDKGFTSTSLRTAKELAPDIPGLSDFSLTIDVPKGTKAFFVHAISGFNEEEELLLDAGMKFKILDVSEIEPGRFAIHVEVRP